MRMLMVGLNHRTASIELRETLAVNPPALPEVLAQLHRRFPEAELALLSTCNRTELYVARPAHASPTVDEMRQALADLSGVKLETLTAATILREQAEAMRHLFRVATGLESMVLGEPQILGQVKRAYEEADRSRCLGPALHRVFQQAIAAAKTARRETGIGSKATSVGSVAVQFARQIFEHFDDKVVLSIGAGEMTKNMLRHMAGLSPGRLCLVNRTRQRALDLAGGMPKDVRVEVRHLDDLDPLLIEADIVLTCTGSEEPILAAKQFAPLARKRRHRPLFILDIAVPRDVDEQVGTFSNVYLYNLDDLQTAASGNAAERQNAVSVCETLINQRVEACMAEIQHRNVGKLIKALRQRLHDIGEQESQRTRRKLEAISNGESEELQELMDEHTRRMINKILHLPLSQLDQREENAPLGFYAAALRRLFDLEE